MCITGVLPEYQRQTQALIDRWGVKSYPPLPGARALDIEDLMRKIQQTQGIKPEAITVFPGATQPVAVYLNRQLGSLYLDAYSGAAIGRPSQKTRQFFGKVTAWHGRQRSSSAAVSRDGRRDQYRCALSGDIGDLDFNWHYAIGI
ncbi:MAG TPA: hypothetical protein VGG97_12940 [Bryobacteraceae bacterium]|jgi:hypothetical protein